MLEGEHSGEEAVREVILAAAPFRRADGSYRLQNRFATWTAALRPDLVTEQRPLDEAVAPRWRHVGAAPAASVSGSISRKAGLKNP